MDIERRWIRSGRGGAGPFFLAGSAPGIGLLRPAVAQEGGGKTDLRRKVARPAPELGGTRARKAETCGGDI